MAHDPPPPPGLPLGIRDPRWPMQFTYSTEATPLSPTFRAMDSTPQDGGARDAIESIMAILGVESRRYAAVIDAVRAVKAQVEVADGMPALVASLARRWRADAMKCLAGVSEYDPFRCGNQQGLTTAAAELERLFGVEGDDRIIRE